MFAAINSLKSIVYLYQSVIVRSHEVQEIKLQRQLAVSDASRLPVVDDRLAGDQTVGNVSSDLEIDTGRCAANESSVLCCYDLKTHSTIVSALGIFVILADVMVQLRIYRR